MKREQIFHLMVIAVMSLLIGCSNGDGDPGEADKAKKTAAARFFKGIYGGDPSVIDELAGEEIVITYPIFQTLFGSPFLSGKGAAVKFVERFDKKWKDKDITIEEMIAENDTVVLVWSFRARDAFIDPTAHKTGGAEAKKSWGGITVYHFDQEGKILSEIGEESEPGPTGRLPR